MGNLGRDPEVRSFQNGGKVCNLRIATSDTWKDRNTGERREKTEWHTVSVFSEGLVRVCEQFLRKGSKVYVEGQMQGGSVQGIGWALNEEYIFSSDGVLMNPGFLDYRIPVASDLPMIETIIVEVPNPSHPYGVRGVGETGIVPPMATIGNAIKAATGVRMTSLPMSPPKVLKALGDAR